MYVPIYLCICCAACARCDEAQSPARLPRSMRVTTSENGITNAIEIARTAAGQLRVICSNNDCVVRLLDAESFRVVGQVGRMWGVCLFGPQVGAMWAACLNFHSLLQAIRSLLLSFLFSFR